MAAQIPRVQQVLDEVKSRESGKRDPGHSLDFCDDIGGTTFDLQACQTLREKRIGRGLTGVEKAVQGRLDANGRDLYAKASETWKKFIQSEAKRASDAYRSGSLQSVAYGQRLNDLAEGRVVTLGKLFDYHPDPSHDSAQFTKADRSLNVAYQNVSKGQDEEARKLLQEAERAWIAYRDAEASFYRHVFGPKFGDAIVETDVKTTLTLERSKKLAQKPRLGRARKYHRYPTSLLQPTNAPIIVFITVVIAHGVTLAGAPPRRTAAR